MRESEDLAEDVAVGRSAQSVLDNPQFKSAMVGAKARQVEKFTNSSPEDTNSREEAYRQLKAMEDFFQELTEMIQSGNVASKELDNRSKSIN